MLQRSPLIILLGLIISTEARLKRFILDQDASTIDIYDLTHPTTWNELADFYGAVEKRWKICLNCGIPGLGTAIHLEHASTAGSVTPAVIPTEYLLTRLAIIDVSHLTALDAAVTLSLDVALQWPALKHDAQEPTLLLFKFGWQRTSNTKKQCICRTPGLSYELGEWIASNLSHVVGVATDAPTLESPQTREFTLRTVSNLLGKQGIYIIENVNLRKRLPEHSCMAIAMPLKLLEASYAPTRLAAFCPSHKTNREVTIALQKHPVAVKFQKSMSRRVYDISLNELLD